jgi:hypothetical protein
MNRYFSSLHTALPVRLRRKPAGRAETRTFTARSGSETHSYIQMPSIQISDAVVWITATSVATSYRKARQDAWCATRDAQSWSPPGVAGTSMACC